MAYKRRNIAITADSEGVVRYPTNYCRGGGGENFAVVQPNQSEESAREKGQRHGQHGEGEVVPPLPADNVENQQQKGQPIDYVKMNAKIHYAEKSPVKEKRDPTRPPPNYQKGVVPKYLQEIKKTNHNKSEDPKRGAGESLPAGHILLSDSDRLDHLRLIRQSYAELVQQLNNLPVRSDSLRARTRRAEIEKELDRLERGIKLFSRDKLYVKVDA
ncbi:hypothetical protein AAG570_006050 [Ranatra chinensis]|uniref:Enkurin domain-containing protein n=1 Tax=Ranatra chinensis TaxID=642074 RepID=A0ABD0YKJ5_9HEMI